MRQQSLIMSQMKKNRHLALAGFLALAAFAPHNALAACTSPAGNAGDIIYSSTSAIMVYCNGTNWVGMGSSTSTSFGTLTTGNFCTASSSTGIACTTAAINLTSQVTGTLPVANGGTGAVTLNAHGVVLGQGTAAETSTGAGTAGQLLIGQGATSDPSFNSMSGDCSISNTGSITCTKTNGVTFGALATAATASLTSQVAGVLPIANGGTNATTQTTNGVNYYNGTSITSNSGLVYNGTQLGIGTASPVAALTVNGTSAFMFGTDYTTTGAQSDVAINTSSTIRYNGTAAATFYGVAAGTNGQIIHLHNASSYTLTLSNQSSSDATAASRIITGTGADLTVASNASVIMQYDTTASRWRVIGGSGGGALSGLSDVTIGTSLATNNLLQYNGTKWVNVPVQNTMTTATMQTNFPDAIKCVYSGSSIVLVAGVMPESGGNYTYVFNQAPSRFQISFNSSGAWVSSDLYTGSWASFTSDCNSKSITQLYASGQAFNFIGTGAVTTFNAGSAAAPGFAVTSNTTTGLFQPASNILGVSTNGTERMRIDSSGNVAIGTATALNTLDVYTGGIHIGNSTPSSTGNALYAIGTSLMWNGASVSSGGTLASLTDATITSPANNQVLTYNGTKWVNAAAATSIAAAIAPSFLVNKNGTGQAANNGDQITFSNKVYDTNNNFSTATGRYTPTIAGKYLLIAQTRCTANVVCWAQIRKNGTVQSIGGFNDDSGYAVRSNIGQTTIILDMNGTTDYADVSVNLYTSDTIVGTTTQTYFSGALLAPLASGSVAGTGTLNYVPRWTSSTNLTSGLLYDNGTTVGLNTATVSASNKLEINGAATIGYTNTAAPTNGLIISGNVGIGTSSPSSTAALDITSTTTGFLPPRMTTTQMNAIASPAAGLTIYNTTANSLYTYNGSSWAAGGSGGGGSSASGGQLLGVYYSTTAVANNSINFTGASNSSPTLVGSTLTLPSNTSYIVVEEWGGGGGAGGSTATYAGGGGGSGGYASKIITSPSGTYYYTIGAGGAGGAAGGSLGASGSSSCFGTNATACTSPILTAGGGQAMGSYIDGGTGGAASGGDINITGGGGLGVTVQGGGLGGTAPLGGSGGRTPGNAGSSAANGAAPGGGGSGGAYSTPMTGGNGGTGGIKISVYASGITSGSIGTGATGNLAYYNASGSAISPSTLVSISTSSVGIGTTSPSSTAALDITSTTTGFLPPRMTTTQMNAITSPAAGLTIYNTTANSLYTYNGSSWAAGGSGGGGGSSGGGGQLLGTYFTTTAGSNRSVIFTGAANSSPSFSGTTLTLPSNTAYIVAEAWGGGGPGGTASTFSGAGAGGGGGYAMKLINNPTGTYYFTVGAAASSSCFGTNATACTSPLITATGGGTGGTASDGNSASGGGGGGASGGDINMNGQVGGGGTFGQSGAGYGSGGAGGSSPFGGSGGASGLIGTAPGGGGAGGWPTGGAGTAGAVGGIKISVYASGLTSGSVGTGATGNLAYYNAAGTAISPSTLVSISTSSIGIGTTTPQATLDVNGFARLSLNSSQPAICSASTQGSIAMTHLARACVCTPSNTWSDLVSGAACSW